MNQVQDMNRVPVIAIDGPSASGKGTISQRVAGELGFHYLESGALYRLVALASLSGSAKHATETELAGIARGLDARFENGNIYLDNYDVTDLVRDEACGRQASVVAAFPLVRSMLLERQRAFRQPPGLVADGRDMGTVVFADATLKIFLTATAAVRASRRHKQLIEKGIDANLPSLLRDLEERDQRDTGRAIAPLAAAEDAVILDSSTLRIDEVVDLVLAEWRKRNVSGVVQAGRVGKSRP